MRAEAAVKTALAAGRWAALIGAGLALWMLGLAALAVPADLPQWRHVAGVVLLGGAMYLWRRAANGQS